MANATTSSATSSANDKPAPKKTYVQTVDFSKTKKSGLVTMDTHISKIALNGTVRLSQEGQDDVVIDLSEIKPEQVAELMAYGLGRHAPDSLKSSSVNYLSELAGYFACYIRGFISPKAEQKALKPAVTKNVKAGNVSREAFELHLEDNGAAIVVEKLSGQSTDAFWVAITNNAKAASILAKFKEELAAKAKAEKEAEQAKAADLLADVDFDF